jgi:hypothetical protein
LSVAGNHDLVALADRKNGRAVPGLGFAHDASVSVDRRPHVARNVRRVKGGLDLLWPGTPLICSMIRIETQAVYAG